MDIAATLLSLISPQAILDLPLQIKGPALFILALMLFRTITYVLKFRLIKASFSLFYTLMLALIISTMGKPIASMMALDADKHSQAQEQKNKN